MTKKLICCLVLLSMVIGVLPIQAEKIDKVVEMTIYERLVVGNLFPRTQGFTEGLIIKDIREKLDISVEESVTWKVDQRNTGLLPWSNEDVMAYTVPITLTSLEIRTINNAIDVKDKAKDLLTAPIYLDVIIKMKDLK